MNKKNIFITIIVIIILVAIIAGIVFGIKKYIKYKNEIEEEELVSSQSEDVTSEEADFEATKEFFSNYKVLILYFPQYGNVDTIAEFIRRCTNGDVVAIECDKVYSDNEEEIKQEWENEKNTNEHINITTEIENFDEYDYIFLGWFNLIDGLPMIVQSFFEEYNFNNKDVVLFGTKNESSYVKSIFPDINIINTYQTSNEYTGMKFEFVKRWMKRVKESIEEYN